VLHKKCKEVISKNIQKIYDDFKENCKLSERNPKNLTLIGASKSQSIANIQEAYDAGLKNFGENYLQEAENKIKSLEGDFIWHFIGSIQSRKAKKIAEIFDWVHTVENTKVAKKLNIARPHSKGPLNICIQVNIDSEESKSGLHLDDLEGFIEESRNLENINIRGLMVIPKPRESIEEQKKVFRKVKETYLNLIEKGNDLDTLSMGMSSDYGSAIQEGATMVRIGTGIFGPRK
tara:strand:+ start:1960 stop:2658 length:699 start_codon:yes stop_codon:yes gene_type:complete